MAQLLKYELDTGTIVGVWESNSLTLLEAQRVAGDSVYGYLLSLEPLAASVVQEGYQVRDGVLRPRPTDAKDG